MTFLRTLLAVCPVACLLAQAPPPKAQAPTPPAAKKSTPAAAPKKSAPPAAAPNAPAVAKAAPTDPADKVVVSVGATKITAKQFDIIVDGLPAQYQAQVRGAGRKQFADNLMRMLVLSEEAKRRKMDQDPQYLAKVQFNNADILASMAYTAISLEVKIDDGAMHKYYDDHKADFERVSARHILIRMQGSPVPVVAGKKDLTDDEAKTKCEELRKKLDAGEDFVALAKAESDDVESGAKGGDLGFFGHNQMVQPFESTAFAMKAGEISQPIKTQFGYHIIKVDAKEAKTFDEVKPELEQKLRPDLTVKAMEELEKKSGATIDAEFFGPVKQ